MKSAFDELLGKNAESNFDEVLFGSRAGNPKFVPRLSPGS